MSTRIDGQPLGGIVGYRPGDLSRKKSKTFGEGRRCAGNGCNVALSRWNPDKHCSICIKKEPS